MKKKIIFFAAVLFSFVLFTGCFSEKKSPFYNSEWIMNNVDDKNQMYYHHLILRPGHKVMLRTSYYDSKNIMVWRGTYKINSRKIFFKFTDCSRFENGKNVGQYSDKRVVNYYNGEYFYSTGLLGDAEEKQEFHLQLIRPKNQIYGETKDIYNNYFEDFVKIENLTDLL